MAGIAYAMSHSLNLNDVLLKASAGDVVMVNEGAVVVKKTSGAATQVTLPPTPASNVGGAFRWVIDGNGDAATYNITVVASSGNINGAASYVISENYGAALFFYPAGGTQWLIAGVFNALSSTELGFLNGVTAGTATASKALVVDSSKGIATITSATITTLTSTLVATGGVRRTDIATLAATGTVQANAAAITNRVTKVTGADNTVGVILPTPTAGDEYLVYSATATNGLKVYPHSAGTINDGSANASITIEGKTLAHFIANDTTNWMTTYTANA